MQEVILWMEHILGAKLPSTDLHESLKSGIVLRELVRLHRCYHCVRGRSH